MKEITGNLWDYVLTGPVVITTNGALNARRECVMGRGTAAQAKTRYPYLPNRIGKMISNYGNRAFLFQMDTDEGEFIITFPVKHHWSEKADLELISQSVGDLIVIADRLHSKEIFMPRPGCGNGGLDWEREVKPILAPRLDDRFTIVERRP